MALVRCTCIYRTTTEDERAAGRPVLTVDFPDPWCPATQVHSRRTAVSRAANGADKS
jgi:hypothetical protein